MTARTTISYLAAAVLRREKTLIGMALSVTVGTVPSLATKPVFLQNVEAKIVTIPKLEKLC